MLLTKICLLPLTSSNAFLICSSLIGSSTGRFTSKNPGPRE